MVVFFKRKGLCGKIVLDMEQLKEIINKNKGGKGVYLVSEKDLKGVGESEVRARVAIVEYLTEWAEEVFYEARKRDTISLAGRYIRTEVLYKGDILAELMDEVVLVDLHDFWKSVDGNRGKRDDVSLYGIFCMLFSEVNEDMKSESLKLEGNIGYAPQLRFDLSERRGSEVGNNNKEEGKKKGIFGISLGKNKKSAKEIADDIDRDEELPVGIIGQIDEVYEEGKDEEGNNLEEDIVEIEDKIVTPDNVNKLIIGAVVVISILVITLAWMILI